MVLQNPFFTFRTTAICRRIKDDSVIGIPPFYFAPDKFKSVFYHPVDPVEISQFSVFPGPGDYRLYRIDMPYLRSFGSCGQGSGPRIGKQIKDLWRGRKIMNAIHYKIPVGGLFRKNADMSEGCKTQPHSESIIP